MFKKKEYFQIFWWFWKLTTLITVVTTGDFSDWPLTEPLLHRDASASKKSFLCIGKCAESCHTSITSLGPRQRCDSQSWRGQFDNLPSHNCMNRWLIYRAIKCPVYIIIYQLVGIIVEWLTAGLAELKMSNVFISLCILQPLESPVKTFVKIKCYETLPWYIFVSKKNSINYINCIL